MRINPSDKYVNRDAVKAENAAKITRIIALIMVGGSTFYFFIKLLFL